MPESRYLYISLSVLGGLGWRRIPPYVILSCIEAGCVLCRLEAGVDLFNALNQKIVRQTAVKHKVLRGTTDRLFLRQKL